MNKLSPTLLLIVCVLFATAQVNLSDSLMAHLPLNGNGLDVSGNGNHATVSGTGAYGALNQTGIANSAMFFNGALEQGVLDFGAPLLNDLDEFSMSFWFNPTQLTNNMSLVGQDNILETGFYTGATRVVVWHPTSGSVNVILTQGVGVWQHIAVTTSPTQMLIYLNGALVETRNGNYTLTNNAFNTRIGGNVVNQSNNTWFRGSIDEVRFYNRILTQDEVNVLSSSLSLTLTVGALTPTTLCAGQSLQVPFTVIGTLQTSNIFTAQLSDKDGNFDNPIAIGSLAGASGGTINAAIPNNLPHGTNYKIRVVSSLPQFVGTVSSASLTINNPSEGVSTLTRDRLVWYKFDTNAADSSGNGIDASLVGGTSFVTDRFGNPTGALQLNGTNGHVQVPAGVYFDGSPFTVSSWVKPVAFNSWSRVYDFGRGQANDNILGALSQTTTGRVAAENYNGATGGRVDALTGMPLNEWSHYVVLYDGAQLSIFINGNLVVKSNVNTPRLVHRNLCYIGRSNWATDGYANAAFDDFMIYSRSLSLDEINSLASDGAVHYNRTPCETGVLQLSAPTIVGATFQWSGPAGFSSTTQSNMIENVTAANSGNYNVTIIQGACTPFVQTTNITVISPANQPAVNFSGLPDTIYVGRAAVALTGTPTNGFFSGSGIDDVNKFNPDLAGEGTHTIYYQVIGVGGCLSVAEKTVVVLPGFNMQNGSANVCKGSFYDSGGGTANYQPNEDYTYTFCSDNGEKLRFTFTAMSIGTGDTLWAYDGNSTNANLLGMYIPNSRVDVIWSSGTCITFRFRSNATAQTTGWIAEFQCMQNPEVALKSVSLGAGINVVCNAKIYDPAGTGNYGYGYNVQTFKSRNGERLRLDVFEFNINFNNGGHWLRVYDGPSTAYPSMGQYNSCCAPPTIFISSGEYLTVEFDATNTQAGVGARAGFGLDLICFGTPLNEYLISDATTVNVCEGVFYDSGGPNVNYDNNEGFAKTFCSDNGQLLRFDFNNFTTAFGAGDTLWAYDGNNVNAPLLGMYIQSSAINPVKSSGTCLTFRFKSNNTGVARGWQGFINCVNSQIAQDTIQNTSGLRTTCDAFISDNSGVFAYGYGYNVQSYKSANGERLKFEYTLFQINGNNGGHWLRIYDGPSTAFPLIGAYNNFNFIPASVESTGEYLTFEFDRNNTAAGVGTQQGYRGNLTCTTPALPVILMSDTVMNICEGVFYDDGGPNVNYRDNQLLTHTFCSENGEFIRFDFNRNNTQFGTGDTLWVFDGDDVNAQPLATFVQGSTIEPMRSTGTCLTFQFFSNATSNGRGWQGYLSCVNYSAPQDTFNMSSGIRNTCDAIVRDPAGTSTYGQGIWTQTYRSKNNMRLKFERTAFAINGNNNGHWLRVYDGPNTSYPLIGQWNNFNFMPASIESTGEYLTFVFDATNTSAGYGGNVGFAGRLYCTTPALPVITITDTVMNICEAVFYDDGGPNGNYSDNYSATHTFCSANGQLLQISFNVNNTQFGTGDTLWAFDGNNVSAPPLAMYIQGSRIETLTSTGTCLTFKFVSNSTSNGRGWQGVISCVNTPPANVTYIMSSGIRNVCKGTFLDPGGTGNYSVGSGQTYIQTFTSYSGERIRATRNSFSINGNNQGHWLDVYDGESIASPLIGSYNNFNFPPVAFQSTGSSLTFRFRATNTSAGSASGWDYTMSCFTGSPIDVDWLSSPVCQGATIDVPFILNDSVNANNIYTAQLSDANGNFNGAVNIGTLATTNGSGTITATIPLATPAGSGYRIRVNSSQPVQLGSQSPNTITIIQTPVQPNNISVSGSTNFCNGVGTATLSITNQSGINYRWILNDTITVGTNSNSYTAMQPGVYKVELSSACDVIVSNASVTINTIAGPTVPVISANGPTSFCTSGSVELSIPAQAGMNYQWKRGTTNVGTNTNTYTATVAGDYTVVVSNTCGNVSSSNTITVSITGSAPTAPTISANGATTFCTGGNVTLSIASQAGANYQWKQNGNDVGTDSENFIATQSGTYTVVVSNGCGMANSINNIAVIVNTAPTIPSISANGPTTFCSGNNVELSISAQSGVDYQWKQGVLNVGGNSNTYTATQAGIYTVEVSNNCGNETSSNAITISISGSAPTAPVISANGPTSFCTGGSVELSVPVEAGVDYQWKEGANDVGGNSNTFSASQTGTYTVELSNQCGTVVSTNSISVTVSGSAPVAPVISANGPTTICAGGNVELSVPQQAGVDYQWLNGGVNTGSNSNTLIATQAGTYTVELSNSCGNALSTNSIVVTITGGAPVTQTISANGATTFCAGDSVVLSVTFESGVDYQWKQGANNIGSNSNSFTATQAGTYTVNMSNGCGTTASSNSITITISGSLPTVPIITANGPTAICTGGNVELSVPQQTGVSYHWKSGSNNVGGNSNTYTATTAAIYTIELSNTCGTVASSNSITVTITGNTPSVPLITANGLTTICAGQQRELSIPAQSGVDYQWKSGANNVGTNSNTFMVTTAGTYTVEVSNGCGTVTSSNSITITVSGSLPTVPTITAGGNTTFCTGGSVLLAVPPQTGVTYQWKRDGTNLGTNLNALTANTAGDYTIELTNNCGTVISDNTITVIVVSSPPTAPTISANGSTTFCTGGSVSLTISAQSGVTYQWKNGANNTGGNTNTLNATQAGVYTVEVSNACGNVTSVNSITITVNAASASQFSETVCAGESYTFNGQAYTQSGQYTATLQNTVGCDSVITLNLTVSSAITSTMTVSNHCGSYDFNGQTLTQSGAYNTTFTAINGCDSIVTLNFTYNAAPVPTITQSFMTLETSFGFADYQWYLNGNEIFGAIGPVHIPLQDGVYTVEVTGFNGCTSVSAPFNFGSVDVRNQILDIRIEIFPNPVSDILFIKTDYTEVLHLELISVDGRTLLYKKFSGDTDLNVTGLTAGMYFLQISDEKGNRKRVKVVRGE